MNTLREEHEYIMSRIVSLKEYLIDAPAVPPEVLPEVFSEEKWLLARQLTVMNHYAIILEKRMDLLTNEK